MQAEKIEEIDREFLRNQERDRINERTTAIWPIFLTMSGAFGLAGLLSINNEGGYIVALFPVLVGCLAQHVNDSEHAQRKNRKILYQQENGADCTSGGEHAFQALKDDAPTGGNKKALRRGFVLTSLFAIGLLLTHMSRDHAPFLLIIAVGAVELYFTGQTFFWLTYWKPVKVWYGRQLSRLQLLLITLRTQKEKQAS